MTIRDQIRFMLFRPAIGFTIFFAWLAFNRNPLGDGLTAVGCALIAYQTRPDWLRRRNVPSVTTSDTSSDSN